MNILNSLINVIPNSAKFKLVAFFRNPLAKVLVGLIDLGLGQVLAYLTKVWPDAFAWLYSNTDINQFTVGLFASYLLLQLWNVIIVRFLTDDVKDLQLDVNKVLGKLGWEKLKVDGAAGKKTVEAINTIVGAVDEFLDKPDVSPTAPVVPVPPPSVEEKDKEEVKKEIKKKLIQKNPNRP